MAYGTPERPEQVEDYFTHIRGGRTPSPEAVERLRRRYERVGGRTPLLEITEKVCSSLERELNNRSDVRYRVYAGMKHWHPYIGEVMPRIAADGINRVIAVALAPHFSRISIGGYHKAVDDSQAKLTNALSVTFVESWHLQPEFLDLIAALARTALAKFPAKERDKVVTVFSAHSLPQRIREWNDPYESQLLASSAAIAQRAGLVDWRFAWQSAGNTGEPWLGPDILDYLGTLHSEGVKSVLQVPIGFVSDHLEILYDLDIEARGKAGDLGMRYERTEMPNAMPEFIRTLAAVVDVATRRSEVPAIALVR
ncbi:MAG: ferrochelatase [Anaerolineae bacterium]|nr:ferrochelatase [Gemmatimonadaceae bacterium]